MTAERYGTGEANSAASSMREHVARALSGAAPVAGIILGSGLGALTRRIERAVSIPFGEIPGFPPATVAGHAGAFVAGRLAGCPVLALAGRFHMYEGHDARLAAFPVRVMR